MPTRHGWNESELAPEHLLHQRQAMVSQMLGLDEIRDAVAAVFSGRPVRRVDLFGSRAKGSEKASSDIDLLVEFDTDAKIGLFEMGAMREELAERLGVHIDLVSRAAVERSRNNIRRESVLSHAVPVYAR